MILTSPGCVLEAAARHARSQVNITSLVNISFSFSSGGQIDFASFLDIMHKHSDTEKCQEEILTAFRAHDPSGKGVVVGPELTHILTKCGEKLSPAEGWRLP